MKQICSNKSIVYSGIFAGCLIATVGCKSKETPSPASSTVSSAATNTEPASDAFGELDAAQIKRRPDAQIIELDLRRVTAIDAAILAQVAALPELTVLRVSDPLFNDGTLKSLSCKATLKILDAGRSSVTDGMASELPKFISLEDVNFDGCAIGDATLAKLSELKKLKRLRVPRTSLTDAGLDSISKLTQLTLLNGAECNAITDSGVEKLAALTSLTSLTLDSPGITNRSMAVIGNLRKLESLSLYRTAITDEGLEQLSGLTALRELGLFGSPVTGAGLTAFENSKKLTKLNLRATNVTDEALITALQKLSQLQALELSETGVTDESLPVIAGLASLEDVNFWLTKITDQGVSLFEGKPLRRLNLDNIPVLTDAAAKSASTIKSLEFLHLGKTGLTDVGLAYLSDLPKLSELHVTQTAVTDAGIAKLQQDLPQLKIVNRKE